MVGKPVRVTRQEFGPSVPISPEERAAFAPKFDRATGRPENDDAELVEKVSMFVALSMRKGGRRPGEPRSGWRFHSEIHASARALPPCAVLTCDAAISGHCVSRSGLPGDVEIGRASPGRRFYRET